jgi:hypothetical protein
MVESYHILPSINAGNTMLYFLSYGLPFAPTCTEEVALIDFRDDIPVLEIGSLSFPIQIVQKFATTKGEVYILFVWVARISRKNIDVHRANRKSKR